MTELNYNNVVMVPAVGRNYHLFSDCHGYNQGQDNNMLNGNDVFVPDYMTVSEAVANGKFACRVCHKRAKMTIPAIADSVGILAARREMRMARQMASVSA